MLFIYTELCQEIIFWKWNDLVLWKWNWLNTTSLPEQIAAEDEAQHKDEEANAKNDDIDVQGERVCDVWGHSAV